MSAFIETIRCYQSEADRAIFDTIRHSMSTDFLSYQNRGGIAAFEQPELYVAFRCIRLISGRLATIKYTLAEHGMKSRQDSPEYIFADFARQLFQWTGIVLTVNNYAEHESYLRDYFQASYPDLLRAYQRLTGIRPTIWHQLTQTIIDEHWDDIAEALDYALLRVDCGRSEREVVRYINFVTRTAYYRKQFSGLRRVRRGGRVLYVKPEYYGAIYAIFGSISTDISRFSGRQRGLIDRMVAIITEDFANGREKEYAVDIRGGYRIVNRYISAKIGVHEASLSRALSRLSVKH